jgi:glycosyltransferase involved in cell wall biosynthesis
MASALQDAGLEVDRVIRNGTREVPPRPALRDPPLAAYAGRLLAKKGVDDLLEAFALVVQQAPHARLLIVGDGPDRGRIQELLERSSIGKQVELREFVPRPPLDELLQDAWVQVLPSRFREPSANVLPEAMMRGTALVATATGGTPELVRDGVTGYLVPPGQPAALAARLAQLLTDRPLAERMGAAARQIALAELGSERMVTQFESAYRELIGVGGGR